MEVECNIKLVHTSPLYLNFDMECNMSQGLLHPCTLLLYTYSRRDNTYTYCIVQLGRHGSSMVAHQTVVLQSLVRIRRLSSPQLTANLLVGCHLGMALGCGLTSVRGNRGENYENEPVLPQKHTKKKKHCTTTIFHTLRSTLTLVYIQLPVSYTASSDLRSLSVRLKYCSM
jgi:hypothetical protein